MNELAMAVLNFMGWLGLTMLVVMIVGCIVAAVGLSITHRWKE